MMTHIARDDRKFYATLNEDILTVYRSVLVTPRSVHYTPVRNLLAKSCFRLLESAELTDVGMACGKAEYLVFELFPDCPGHSLWHVCVIERGRAWN